MGLVACSLLAEELFFLPQEWVPPPPPFTSRVVVSTPQPGVFVMTAYCALIRPSGEGAMGRSCILDPPPPQGQGDARGSADGLRPIKNFLQRLRRL